MLSELKPAFRLVLVMTTITGVAYPVAVTGLAHLAFPFQAGGSLWREGDRVIGSPLIGQRFERPEFFHGRPSAAGSAGYDPRESGASNLAPTSRTRIERATVAATAARADYPAGQAPPVPLALVTASASGLDPDISPAAAFYQVPRVARTRQLSEEAVRALVTAQIEPRTYGVLGEPRVNVLKLNLALEELDKAAGRATEPR